MTKARPRRDHRLPSRSSAEESPMKTCIAAVTSAVVLAVPGAALARPADTAPDVPKIPTTGTAAGSTVVPTDRLHRPPNFPTAAGASRPAAQPPNTGTAQYRPAAIAAQQPAAARSVAGQNGDTDGTGTLTVILIAGGAALAAAGSGFAAGRMRVQRQHGLGG